MIVINWNLPGQSADSWESREVKMSQRQVTVVEGRVTTYSLQFFPEKQVAYSWSYKYGLKN